ATRRSSTDPSKRSSTRIEIAAAPDAWNPATSGAGSAPARRSPADGERRLNSATAARPGPARASRKLAMVRERDGGVEPLRGGARVEGPPGEPEAGRGVARVPAGSDRTCGGEQDRVAARPVLLAREDRPDRGRVLGWRAAAEVLGRAAGDAEVERV